jgi:polysaccharide chain length determinant protein (PEP-CTERM system associated)
MKERVESALSLFRSANRFRNKGLQAAWAVFIVLATSSFFLENKYPSNAQIYVDTRSILGPLLQGLAVSTATLDQTDVMRRAILSRPSLTAVAAKTGIGTKAKNPKELEAILEKLSDDVSVTGDVKTGIFTIAYFSNNAATSQKVVQTLLDSLVLDSLGANRSDSQGAEAFLKQQVDEYSKRLSELDGKIAAFKKDNIGFMPDQRGDMFGRLQAEKATLERAESELSQLQRQKSELQRKISGEVGVGTGSAGLPSPGQIQAATAVDAQIRENNRKLDDLLTRYTENHPDVIALKGTIAQLQVRRATELGGVVATNGATTPTSSVSIDPVLQSLQISLNAIDVQFASVQSQVERSRANVGKLTGTLSVGPEIEAEMARLNRDYGVTKTQYEALLQRLETARISNDVDRSSNQRFRIIEPPRLALLPTRPNRPLLLFAALVTSIAAGLGVTLLMTLVHPVFETADSVATKTGLPVVGVVSYAEDSLTQSSNFLHRNLAYMFGLVALPVIALLASRYSGAASVAISSLLRRD